MIVENIILNGPLIKTEIYPYSYFHARGVKINVKDPFLFQFMIGDLYKKGFHPKRLVEINDDQINERVIFQQTTDSLEKAILNVHKKGFYLGLGVGLMAFALINLIASLVIYFLREVA